MNREQEQLVQMLRRLPVSIQITERENGFVWQCLHANGIADNFEAAVEDALNALIARLLVQKAQGPGNIVC